MNPDIFSDRSPGHLVPTIGNQNAFVPNELPPKIEREALFDDYGAAMAALGSLNAKIAQLANPNLIIRPLQRQEALASSAMEGTFTTNDELALYEAGVDRNARPETVEVQNYAQALAEATSALEKLPISHRLIRNAHATLLANLTNIRGGNKRPGDYKQEQNWIGGRTIEQARFIPPPPQQAQEAMDALERYLNRGNIASVPPLIEAALVHYQFETIHPFADGNGRVGRILIPVLLLARNAMQTPVFYPSAVLEHRKDEYIDLMFNVSVHGQWTAWIKFFLEICVETCVASSAVIDKLMALQERYRERVMDVSRSNNPLILLDFLFSVPVMTTPTAADILSVTPRAARSSIRTLEDAGALQKLEGTRKPELFVAREILNVRP